MRPVNLIPADQRKGDQALTRTGPLAYVVIGVLVAVLAGVASLVLTNNQISDRKADVARLEAEHAAMEARAERLAAYTSFRELSAQRASTVSSLADTRFDWERVIRELSLVLPDDVWLTNLTGSVSPAVQVEGSPSISARQSVPGPALELTGCAAGQESVARFVAALHDIDGVTRVGVSNSQLPGAESAAGGSSSGGSSADCQTRNFVAEFEIVVAFDAAPVPASATAPTTVPTPTPPAPGAESTTTPSSDTSASTITTTPAGG